jgi:hypothetical protein
MEGRGEGEAKGFAGKKVVPPWPKFFSDIALFLSFSKKQARARLGSEPVFYLHM